jgi:hypothetical protein
MTPDERELRRALAERIGRPSPDFVARVSHALSVEKRVSNYLPALALTAAIVLTVSTIGILVLARHAARTVPSASPSSGALAAWQGFPADRKPRPIVLLRNFSPSRGFSTIEGKIAFLCSRFSLGGRLPTEVPSQANASWADGTKAAYPAISARDAYTAMTRTTPEISSPDCNVMPKVASGTRSTVASSTRSTVAPVFVLGARLGVTGFETDRGLAQISAWLFTAAGANSDLAYPAVAASAIWGGGITNWSRLNSVTVSGDGRLLDLGLRTGGIGPCDINYKAFVAESTTAVALTLEEIPPSPLTTPVTCAAASYAPTLKVALATPLGGRVVIDAAGAAISVCPEARPLTCYYTYPPLGGG